MKTIIHTNRFVRINEDSSAGPSELNIKSPVYVLGSQHTDGMIRTPSNPEDYWGVEIGASVVTVDGVEVSSMEIAVSIIGSESCRVSMKYTVNGIESSWHLYTLSMNTDMISILGEMVFMDERLGTSLMPSMVKSAWSSYISVCETAAYVDVDWVKRKGEPVEEKYWPKWIIGHMANTVRDYKRFKSIIRDRSNRLPRFGEMDGMLNELLQEKGHIIEGRLEFSPVKRDEVRWKCKTMGVNEDGSAQVMFRIVTEGISSEMTISMPTSFELMKNAVTEFTQTLASDNPALKGCMYARIDYIDAMPILDYWHKSVR